MLSNLPSQIRQEMEFIRPIVEDRFARMEEFGEDWDDKPVCWSALLHVNVIVNARIQNDMLMWLMSEAKGVERSIDGLARRLLVVNFAAIHTTSNVSHSDPPYDLLIANTYRHLSMYYTVFSPTPNVSDLYGTTLRLRSQRRAGPRPG